MIGLDTNVLLRWLVDMANWPDDAPEQPTLTAETLARRDGHFFVNVIVPAETVWVLARPLRQRKTLLGTVVRRLLGAANIEIEQREAMTRALAAWATGTGDFSNHLLGVLNEQAGCTITLAFDRKAARAGSFTHLAREPSQG